jgi:uncharacterized membrane protein YagU involved in acid resistance
MAERDPAPEQRGAPPRAALWAGALAGTLDITAAGIQSFLNQRSPIRMLQGIASGWLGRRSFDGGMATAALGLVTHFFIAFTAATVYWATSRRYPQLVRHAWRWGASYALVVYAVMYEIVIPLSAIHRHIPRTPQDYITQLLIHVFCVGLPIALTVRAHTPRRDIEPI